MLQCEIQWCSCMEAFKKMCSEIFSSVSEQDIITTVIYKVVSLILNTYYRVITAEQWTIMQQLHKSIQEHTWEDRHSREDSARQSSSRLQGPYCWIGAPGAWVRREHRIRSAPLAPHPVPLFLIQWLRLDRSTWCTSSSGAQDMFSVWPIPSLIWT